MQNQNLLIPQVCKVTTLNAKFKRNVNTFYGQATNGNVTVMNFKNGNEGFSLDRVRDITTALSVDLKNNMNDPNVNVMVSVGVRFPFGYKSSTHLTQLGDDTNIWDPYEYDPDEHVLAKYNDPNMKIYSFDVYLIMNQNGGGCGKYNDCLFDCLMKLTNGHMPDKINHPKKLKKFFGVERIDLINATSSKMKDLEILLSNCNLYIGGNESYYTSCQQNDRYYKYHINLKGAHYTVKHMADRVKLGFSFHEELSPMIFKMGKDTVEVYDGEKQRNISFDKFQKYKTEYKYIMIPVEKSGDFKQTYLDFIKGADELKIATKESVYQINLYKTGSLRNTVRDLFTKMTYGIDEPDEIDEFEGNLLMRGNRGGLQFMNQYDGPAYKYDFVSRYSSIMNSTKCIPMKKGKFITMSQEEIDIIASKKHTPKFGI